jgi:D-alanine-D-alanine ligase
MSGLSVAVVAGGPSAEAEVSRSSARGVSDALRTAGHEVSLFELDEALPGQLLSTHFDVVFPVTHGPLGEDGCLQGMLEVLRLPYVGSGVLASALAASKPHAKAQLAAAGVPVARQALLRAGENIEPHLREIRKELGAAIVIKPASGGSAIGVEIVPATMSDGDAVAAAKRCFVLEPLALVEVFLPGAEVTCGVLEEDAGLRALPPTLIRPRAAAHYDFVSKYRAGGSEHVCPAPFAPALISRIQELALLTHQTLGCRDLSRVDFVVDTATDSLFVLESNTLPGMTATSLFPEAARVAGIEFSVMCDRLIRRAAARPQRAAQAAVAMP